ncbi:MAG: hypothetical protein R3Y11_03305 [Pseudomonadota bacterium]
MSNTIQSSQISSTIVSLQAKENKSAEETQLLQQLQALDLTSDSVTIADSLYKSVQSWSQESTSFLPLPQGKVDVNGAINALNTMENMMLLISQLSREMRQASFQEAKNLIDAKIVDLKASADLKTEGAAELRNSATNALIIGCVAGAVGIIGGGIGLGLSAKLPDTAKLISDLASTTSQALNAGTSFETTTGQAANQEFNALADEKQADSAAKESLAKEQQDLEDAAKSLLAKMTDLLQSIADIKQKGAEAAAKA